MKGYLIFDVDFYAFQVEKLLKQSKISHKITTIPREISSDCGIAIYIDDFSLVDLLLTNYNIPYKLKEIKN